MIMEDGAAGGRIGWPTVGDNRADTGSHIKQIPTNQRRNNPLSSIRVDLQLLAEGPNRGKAIASLQLSSDNRSGDREDDLVVKWATGLQPDAEREQHECTSYASAPTAVKVYGVNSQMQSSPKKINGWRQLCTQ
jgi:hypothetical protein